MTLTFDLQKRISSSLSPSEHCNKFEASCFFGKKVCDKNDKMNEINLFEPNAELNIVICELAQHCSQRLSYTRSHLLSS